MYRVPIGFYKTKMCGGTYTIIGPDGKPVVGPDGKPVRATVPDAEFWVYYSPNGMKPVARIKPGGRI
jgi:hypothetical protein